MPSRFIQSLFTQQSLKSNPPSIIDISNMHHKLTNQRAELNTFKQLLPLLCNVVHSDMFYSFFVCCQQMLFVCSRVRNIDVIHEAALSSLCLMMRNRICRGPEVMSSLNAIIKYFRSLDQCVNRYFYPKPF